MRIKANYRKGQQVRITSDNDSYAGYMNEVLVISGVFRSVKEHPGFDESCGQALYEFKVKSTREVLPFALYEYEFEGV